MSVTYTALDRKGNTFPEDSSIEPCLCTQMDDAFHDAMDAMGSHPSRELQKRLERAADPSCSWCHGRGVERQDTVLDHNLANTNAKTLWSLIGMDEWEYGEAPVHELKAALQVLLQVQGTLGIKSDSGSNIEVDDRPGRAKVFKNVPQIEHMMHKAERFLEFLRTAEKKGAFKIRWG